MSKHRIAAFCFFIGQNGTGKSTAMKSFLKTNSRNLIFPSSELDKAWADYEKIKPMKVVVPDPRSTPGRPREKFEFRIPNINTFKGTRVVDLSEIRTDTELVDLFNSVIFGQSRFMKGGLFIDDFKNYVKSHGKLPYHVKKLMTNYRHNEQDLFFATHSFNEVNSQFCAHNPVFYMFKSGNPPNKNYLKNINNPQAFLDTYFHVQKMAKQNPHFCARYVEPEKE